MLKFIALFFSLLQFQFPVIAGNTFFDEKQLLQVSATFEKNEDNIAPIVQAKAAIVMDMATSDILYAKNIHEQLPIASLTKLMTSLVVTDEMSPDTVVKVTQDAMKFNGNGASTVGLRVGERMDIRNLLHASLIRSGNDAASAMAVGDAGSTESFVEKMNQRAEVLGLKNTHFSNPVGFDQEDNYSTAFELALIAKQAFRKPLIREIMAKESYELHDADGKSRGPISNTNSLLRSYLNIVAGKTGTTPKAGQCLFSVVKNDAGHEILIIVLNSPNRYQEAKIITDWVFRSFTWPEDIKKSAV